MTGRPPGCRGGRGRGSVVDSASVQVGTRSDCASRSPVTVTNCCSQDGPCCPAGPQAQNELSCSVVRASSNERDRASLSLAVTQRAAAVRIRCSGIWGQLCCQCQGGCSFPLLSQSHHARAAARRRGAAVPDEVGRSLRCTRVRTSFVFCRLK